MSSAAAAAAAAGASATALLLGCVVRADDEGVQKELSELMRRMGSREIATLLNERTQQGLTPLHLAVLSCNARIVETLLQCGADPNVHATLPASERARLSLVFDTPLQLAASRGLPHIVRLLVLHGAAVDDAAGGTAATALHCSACAEVTDALLEAGADARARMRDGRSALHTAVQYLPIGEAEKVASALLRAGALPAAIDASGKTPHDLLSERTVEGKTRLLAVLASRSRSCDCACM